MYNFGIKSQDSNVAKHFSHYNDKYIDVPGDNAPNSIVSVCKSHCIYCLKQKLGIE